MEIPLPPLEEQRRIVRRIEALAGRVSEAQRLRREAEEEASLVAGNAIHSIFEQIKPGWNRVKLGDITNDIRYGTSEKAFDIPLGLPVIRMGNIQDGKLDFSDLKYTKLPPREIEKLILKKGDILINRTNSAELVGKCAVFQAGGDYVFASYIIRVRLDEHKALPDLIAAYINSPIGRRYMFDERKQMTGQANINSQKLLALPIPLPKLDEQRRIVAYLERLQVQVDGLRQLQADTQKELEALLPSLLDRAFKGEL